MWIKFIKTNYIDAKWICNISLSVQILHSDLW